MTVESEPFNGRVHAIGSFICGSSGCIATHYEKPERDVAGALMEDAGDWLTARLRATRLTIRLCDQLRDLPLPAEVTSTVAELGSALDAVEEALDRRAGPWTAAEPNDAHVRLAHAVDRLRLGLQRRGIAVPADPVDAALDAIDQLGTMPGDHCCGGERCGTTQEQGGSAAP